MCSENKRLEFRKSEDNKSRQCLGLICCYGLGAKDVCVEKQGLRTEELQRVIDRKLGIVQVDML